MIRSRELFIGTISDGITGEFHEPTSEHGMLAGELSLTSGEV